MLDQHHHSVFQLPSEEQRSTQRPWITLNGLILKGMVIVCDVKVILLGTVLMAHL